MPSRLHQAALDGIDHDGGAFLHAGLPAVDSTPRASRIETSPPARGSRLALIEGYDGFEALREEWCDLHRRAALPHQLLQSYEWFWHWNRHARQVDRRSTPVVLTARREGRLVMLWPLTRHRRHGMRVIGWMAAQALPYGDVLIEPGPSAEDDLRAGWAYLCDHGGADAIELCHVREDAAVAGLARALGLRSVRDELACRLDMRAIGDWERFAAAQSVKRRRNRLRQRRRLEECGDVRFEVIGEGDRARELMRRALEIKRRWVRAKRVYSAAFACPWFDAFAIDLAGSTVDPGGCRIGCLTLSGHPVAITVGFLRDGYLLLHIVAHEPALEFCSPGSLVFEDMLRWAFNEGCTTFDLAWPGSAHKAEFAPDETPVHDYSVALTRRGRMHAGIIARARSSAKAFYVALPAIARRRVARLIGR